MSDHHLDLEIKRINDALKKDAADVLAKKTEHDTLAQNMKMWEENLKNGKAKIIMLEKQMHDLESAHRINLNKLSSMTQKLHAEMEQMKKATAQANSKTPPPHSFLK